VTRPAGGAIADALRAAAERLRAAGVPTPELDAEVLLASALGVSRARVAAERRSPLAATDAEAFASLLERRSRREPVAYLTGEREFWSLELAVDPRVLVPRPETETVVEEAVRWLRARSAGARVADVGTGSGAIALAVAAEAAAGVRVVAIDRSAPALAVARDNARRLAPRLRARVSFARADLLAPFASGSLDLVVANPPYLSPADLASAEPELRFEPLEALAGGDGDGLGVVRRLLREARRALREGGAAAIEIGAGQGAAAVAAATAAGFGEVRVVRDLAGRDRLLLAGGIGETRSGATLARG